MKVAPGCSPPANRGPRSAESVPSYRASKCIFPTDCGKVLSWGPVLKFQVRVHKPRELPL